MNVSKSVLPGIVRTTVRNVDGWEEESEIVLVEDSRPSQLMLEMKNKAVRIEELQQQNSFLSRQKPREPIQGKATCCTCGKDGHIRRDCSSQNTGTSLEISSSACSSSAFY